MMSDYLVYRFASAWREGIKTMTKRVFAALIAAIIAGLCVGAGAARAQEVVPYKPAPAVIPAPATVFGLYRGSDFQLVRGDCRDCGAPKQALWYFRDELVAVPAHGVPAARFSRGVPAQEDVKRWFAGAGAGDGIGDDLRARPPLIWVGASRLVHDARLAPDGRSFTIGNHASVPFAVTPKIKSNLSYYDDSSQAYFRERLLRMRGEYQGDTFVARTVWPQEWIIDETRLAPQPLQPGESLLGLVRKYRSARDERFEARLLWEKTPNAARDWSGHAAIGIMLNGAQGDDDEAHGGHFAVVTGRFGANANGGHGGEMADWMVNNFYNLNSFSEKGITAAMLPMDNYMADLNSGQSWYRPSYMVVAVLRNDRAAFAYQGAISRVYHHFYRHDFEYRHASANCAGVSIDTLRTLGWNIPAQGPTSVVKAIAGYPYKSFTDRSFASGKQAYDYMIEEQTRLYPAAAFDAAGRDLMRLAGGPGNAGAGGLETLLREDIEALVFVRLPQIPSSRAFGSFPVASFDEYMKRVPEDKSQWKIVPVDARPFPPELLEPDTLKERETPPWAPALGSAALFAGALSLVSVRHVRKRRARKADERVEKV